MLRKGVVAIPNSRVSPEAAVSNTDPQEEPKTMLLSNIPTTPKLPTGVLYKEKT